MSTGSLLYCRIANFFVDATLLRQHYQSVVVGVPSTCYRDNEVNYIGWAVTSRDGTLDDGVRRIDPKSGGKRGVLATEINTGYLKEVMDRLESLSIKPYRARIMTLANEGTLMGWHTDAEKEAWRLHIPIVTSNEAFFQWKLDNGEIVSVNLPADGSAWLVRVDITHRAVNLSSTPQERVHLLMGLGQLPSIDMMSAPMHRLK